MKSLLNRFIFKVNNWGDFRSIIPLSNKFGYDRGTPIDRYYIEKFIRKNKSLIKGITLEISESTYTKKYNSGIECIEILHYDNSNPNATIIGDLTESSTLPNNKIDCFICTQTLNFIFDVDTAIKGIYYLLKKNGTALITVAGISQISRHDAERWGDYWRFTPQGVHKLFSKYFTDENIEIESYGNSLSAISYLKGLAQEELTSDELNYYDADYPVLIGIKVKK